MALIRDSNKLGRPLVGGIYGAAVVALTHCPITQQGAVVSEPGRRQTRRAHILQTGLPLAIAQADAGPVTPLSLR